VLEVKTEMVKARMVEVKKGRSKGRIVGVKKERKERIKPLVECKSGFVITSIAISSW